jgi:hypothetical protein
VKLAATFCLAVLSLAGCATEEVNTGGSYLFTRSTKISTDPAGSIEAQNQLPDDPNGIELKGMLNLPEGISPAEIVAEEVNPDFPIAGVCEDCLVTYIRFPASSGSEVGEIRVVSDGGMQLCTIFLDPNGEYDTSDCNP